VTDLLLALVVVLLAVGLAGGIVALRRLRASLDRRFSAVDAAVARLAKRTEGPTIATVLAELARLDERHDARLAGLEAALARSLREHTAPLRAGKQSLEQRTRRAVAHDVHALLELHTALPLGGESLPLTGYSADPGTLVRLTTLVEELPDGALILELGSGLSTVWMAAAARRENRGLRILSIDHDLHWGEQTRAAVGRLGLDSVAEVRVAPLVPLPAAASDAAPWYDEAVFADADGIAMLVVDGPPRREGPLVRYPALPRLAGRLAHDAVVVLDDTDRDDEAEILTKWLALLDGEREVLVESGLDRTTVLRLGPPVDRAGDR